MMVKARRFKSRYVIGPKWSGIHRQSKPEDNSQEYRKDININTGSLKITIAKLDKVGNFIKKG